MLLQTLVPEPGDKAHNTTQDGVAPGVFLFTWDCLGMQEYHQRVVVTGCYCTTTSQESAVTRASA